MIRQKNGSDGKKVLKLKIKPFKKIPTLPSNYEDVTWGKLSDAVDAIFNKAPLLVKTTKESGGLQGDGQEQVSREELYRSVENAGCMSIWDAGLHVYRDHFTTVNEGVVSEKVVQGLIMTIESERSGMAINRDLVKQLLKMLLSTGIYRSKFESLFLASASASFKSEGLSMMVDLNVPLFLQHVHRRLQQSHDMCAAYLDASTRGALVKVIEDNLFNPHTDAVLRGGFDEMMGEERVEGLGMLYRLMERVGKLQSVKEALGEYVKGKSSLKSVHQKAFDGIEMFKYAVKDAFEESLNNHGNKPPTLLCKFVDAKLKQSKGITETQVEKVLVETMALFRHLSNKDVFEVLYRKDLSKRLLFRKSSSMDLEKFFISELKNECGAGYTSKIEGMFKDMNMSEEITSQYEIYAKDKGGDDESSAAGSTKMELWVLTAGYWPSDEQPHKLSLPPSLIAHQERFEAYYANKYQGRRVEWKHNLSTCQVDFNLPSFKSKKTLEISELQALVLLCFNDGGAKKMSALLETTGIQRDELAAILQSLAMGKISKDKGTTRVLMKSSKNKEILDSDEFSVNTAFAHKLSRIKIPNISSKKAEDEKEEAKALESVSRDRMHQIDAACIRIMKSRKTMKHQDLMGEIMTQLKFKAVSQDIKRRIESLIEREYMERGDEHGSYNYLA
ncbi:hypothetical protein TrRE_jg11668 [Triparma retinervis]|uniref:Cullin family profile domain-containing protein n=1 Tax=Triparma retinervis TaxID=2557542 RepID=A0A9W7CE37_9STRA|nr:hypothetical protein TrRE_jg11668 [Triparma retinervis]